WNGGEEALTIGRRVFDAHEGGQQRGLTDHRVHAVHANVVRPELDRERLARDDHRALAAVVPDEAGPWTDARGRRDIDKHAAATLAEIWNERAHAPVDAFDVHRIHAVELGFGDVEYRLVAMRGARVVDDDLHAAEVFERRLQQLVPVAAARDVAGDRDGL